MTRSTPTPTSAEPTRAVGPTSAAPTAAPTATSSLPEHVLRDVLQTYPTPLYVFDEAELRRQRDHLRALLPADVTLCYAMKANSFVLPAMAHLVDRIEVCSPGEAYTCFELGVSETSMVISGVYKDPSFIRELALQHPRIACYTIESRSQFELLAQASAEAGRTLDVLIRLTSGNQFGVSKDELIDLALRTTQTPGLKLRGIQFFSGTQKTSVKRLRRELRQVAGVICCLRDEHGIALDVLEFGPGTPVNYYAEPEEARSEQDETLTGLAELLGELRRDARFDGQIVLEMGRAMVASCGTYLTSVVDVKRNGVGNFAIVDGGRHQFVYYGSALATHPPLDVLSAAPAGSDSAQPDVQPETWSIAGALCTVNDILAKQVELPSLAPGDVVVFGRAGAYCMSEGIALFLSRDLPRIVARHEDGSITLMRDRIETHPLNTPA